MHPFLRKIRQCCAALLLIIITPAFATAAEIAVTLPPLAGLVQMLDNQSEVICLLPAGADPHHLQLSPRKIERLAKTALLIRASRDDGGWPLPPKHGNTLDLWPEDDHGWLSPGMVRHILPRIADALISISPEKEAAIRRNLGTALQKADSIEQQWRAVLTTVKNSGVMMQHPAWHRLMKEMSVPILAVLESGHHGHEHGPHALEEALRDLQNHPGAWLISDAGHNNRAINWLRQHAGLELHHARLDALGSCNISWEKLMQNNLAQFEQVRHP